MQILRYITKIYYQQCNFLQFMRLQEECKLFKEAKENLLHEIVSTKNHCNQSEEKLLQIEADLLNALAEVNVSIPYLC